MGKHIVARVGDIAPGAHRMVSIEGREIGVFNVKGQFYALLNRCPHEAAALCQGAVVGLALAEGVGSYKLTREGEFIRCPWHGWEFEIATGQSYCDPKKLRARHYDVTVEHGADLVKGPYVAEAFKVTREDDYVVLEL